jgi:transposase InsO family protein
VVGWSIDSTSSTALVTNALGMAINERRPRDETISHSDQGTQLSSWAFSRHALVELLNRKRWTTRLELSNAIFECFEVFHNRRRRPSSLSMLTPAEFEAPNQPTTAA